MSLFTYMSMFTSKRVLTVLLFLIGIGIELPLAAQTSITFKNPSLEGTPQWGTPPPNWAICGNLSTPDTQPGFYGVTTTPANGSSFVSMVCRWDGTYEAISQKVDLQAGVSYCFQLQLAFSSAVVDGESPHRPACMRIWSGTGAGDAQSCKRKELLWTSPVIDHTEWKHYSVSFTCKQSQPLIIFETYYTEPKPYLGRVLMDHIESVGSADLLPSDTLFCLDDSLLLSPRLLADQSMESWEWKDQTGQVLSDQSAVWISQPGTYYLTTSNGCIRFQDSIRIGTKECFDQFYIPNVITPNGDGVNDTFAFRGVSRNQWQLWIINRWGEVVYQSANYQQDWSAQGWPAGMYYYRLEKRGFPALTGYLQVLY